MIFVLNQLKLIKKICSIGNLEYILKSYSYFLFWKLGKLKFDYEEYLLIY